MMRRMIGAGVFGIVGVAILVSLGVWQVSRLAWKEAAIAAIEARIHADPLPVPVDANRARDRYMPVTTGGRLTGEVVDVLSSQPGAGPGSRVIAVLETPEGRRLLVDRGFVPEAARAALPLAAEGVAITGNLDWPADSDRFTPAPDLGRGLWFSRDAEPLAAFLQAEPFLIVASRDSAAAPPLTTTPINTAAIPNNHLEYAITWFLLAGVWAMMTIALVWRIRRSTV